MKKIYIIVLYIIFAVVLLFFVYKKYLNVFYLLYSIVIIMFLALYKLLLGLSCNDEIVLLFQKPVFMNFFEKLNERILKKNVWLIKPIYYFLYYFPTNWPYLIILLLGRTWWDIRLFINSNKDVVGKKYFNKDLSKKGSILNLKYIKWFKKYIYDVCFRSLFLFSYFRFGLMRVQWGPFFFFRIFGIVYSTILIINNLHIINWFKNTDVLSFSNKIIIGFVCLYLILLFLPIFNKFYLGKVYQTALEIINDIKEADSFKNDEKLRIKINQLFSFYMQECLLNPTVLNYYYMKDFLLLLSLSNKYLYFIDSFYYMYISKNIVNKNVNDVVKYGCLSTYNRNINFIQFLNSFIDTNLKYNYFDIIYIYEKNYRISSFLYGFFFSILVDYEKKKLSYELYKTFYGDDIVDEYFGKEFEEYEELYFIYLLWSYWLLDCKKANLIVQNIINNGFNDVPLHIKRNLEYNKILEAFKFIVYIGNSSWLYWLGYENLNDIDNVLTINIVYNDIKRYEHMYKKDKTKFINFWVNNNKKLDDPLMKFRLEAFDHYWKVEDKILFLDQKVKTFYYENVIKQNNDFIDVLILLQKDYKKKYFSKKPVLNETYMFLKKHKIKEKWNYFSK